MAQGSTTLASYAYDAAGRLATLTRANGATTSHSYDGVNQLTDLRTTVGGSDVTRFQYTYNRVGLRTGVTERLPGATRTISYTYDGLQRLTDATESGATSNVYGYGYDLAGNRTRVTTNGVTTTFSFNAANQRTDLSYDAAGNLTGDGTTTYAWDALGRLVTQGTVTNAYNGDGVLVQRGATRYAVDTGRGLSQILSDGTSTYLYGTERLRAAGAAWYLSDALGSVRATLDDSGTVQGSLGYDPWGQAQGTALAPFGFTGELQDGQNVYLRARWYHAGQGTLFGRDPFAGFAETPYSLHPYAYAYSDPVRFTDPTGLSSAFGGGATGAIGGGITPFPCHVLWLEWLCGPKPTPPDVPGGGIGCPGGGGKPPWIFTPPELKLPPSLMNPGQGPTKTKPGDDPDDELSVFMPGADTPITTQHIMDAIAANPQWTKLTYMGKDANGDSIKHPRGWLRSQKECQGKKPKLEACDEYPFATTFEGGQKNKPSLKIVPIEESNQQGGDWNGFRKQCDLQAGEQFIVAPSFVRPRTDWRCKDGSWRTQKIKP